MPDSKALVTSRFGVVRAAFDADARVVHSARDQHVEPRLLCHACARQDARVVADGRGDRFGQRERARFASRRGQRPHQAVDVRVRRRVCAVRVG
jgi:hypothetical protein